MYQMNNELPFTRCGGDGKLKLHDAAALMMDCCQFQEYQEKEFCHFLRSSNIAIFLSSIQIDILRMPVFREKVTTAVKIYGFKSIYGLRRITMHDEAGNLCLISNATGAFIDLSTQKALKPDPENFHLVFDEAEEMECLPRKIALPAGEGQSLEPFRVQASHLDPNGHLTTPVYFAISSDRLPPDFSYSRVRVEFKQQAKSGELLLPELYSKDADTIIIDIKSAAGTSCAVAEFSNPAHLK